MPEIHVRGGRLFSVASPGLVVRKDELALLEESDGVAFVLSGNVQGGDSNSVFSLTTEGRLRVDASDNRSQFGGNPWSGRSSLFGKSPW